MWALLKQHHSFTHSHTGRARDRTTSRRINRSPPLVRNTKETWPQSTCHTTRDRDTHTQWSVYYSVSQSKGDTLKWWFSAQKSKQKIFRWLHKSIHSSVNLLLTSGIGADFEKPTDVRTAVTQVLKKKTPLIWEAEMELLPENTFSFLIYNP